MLKFKMSLLMQNAKFKAAVITLLIASIVAGIIYIPRNKAKTTNTSVSTQLTSNQIISQSAKLIGKGYGKVNGDGSAHGVADWNVWKKRNSNFKLKDISKFNFMDCTGMIYYALTSLGVSTTGFNLNNPVPVDPNHWYLDAKGNKVTTATSSLKVNYNGTTSNIKVLKANEPVHVRPYYIDANGNELPSGTIVVANGKAAGSQYHDHAWIYIGNLGTSDPKVAAQKLVNEYGVDYNLLFDANGNLKKYEATKAVTDKNNNLTSTTKQGKFDVVQKTDPTSTYWRIECTAGDKTNSNIPAGIYINNGNPTGDYRKASSGEYKVIGPIYAFQLASEPEVKIEGQYNVELVKVNSKGETITTDEATFEINGKSQNTAKGVLNITTNKEIESEEQKDTYTIKETKAPEGYNPYTGTITLNVGFKKDGKKYIIDASKTSCTAPGLSGKLFEVVDNNTKIRIYVPNEDIPEEPEGKYSIELAKVKADGTTVITSDEATFEINGKAISTESGKLTVVSNKEIANTNQKDIYTIKETKAPEGYDKFIGDLGLEVAFKLNEKTNTYIIDANNTKGTGFENKTRFEVSQDGTRITVYVPNSGTPKIHKGVDSVENQDAGYYYSDLKTDKKYTEDQLAKVLHKWVIETSIEDGIENYNKYVVTDKVDTTKLDFAGLDKVVVSLVDLEGKETSLKLNEDYKVSYENDTLVVTLIDKEFTSNTIKNAKVGSLTGYKLRTVFNTTFKVVDGKLVVLTNGITNAENQAVLTYDNGSGKEVNKESEKPEVHTGAVSVFKYNDENGNKVHDKGEKALVGAEFKIAESKEDAAANKFVKDANGNDLIAISNEHGVATFTGLEFGGKATENGTKQSDGTYKYDLTKASKDYYIVETKAPEGFLLMAEAVKVTVSKNSAECVDLTDKMEAIANQEIKGAYNFRITKKDAETTKVIEDETTVFDIKVYSKVEKDGTVNEKDLVELKDINGNTINTKNIHAKTNGITDITNIKITDSEKKAGTYYFVIEETQAPDQYTEIDYRVVVPVKFELKGTEYVAKHDSSNAYALAKVNGKEVKKSLNEVATSNNGCTSSEQVGLTINVNVPNRHKEFDLSLRKFISAVNDIAPETSREPQVDVSALASGKSTTATYNHTKEPLYVNTTDVVTYTFRMYNEGEIDGYASEIMDSIPEGLEFLPESETNKKYKWVMYKEASEGENLVTIDEKTYVKTDKAEEANIIVSDYLKMQNGKANLIKAFDGKTLSYKDIKADFKVVEPTTSDRIVTNYSQITKHTDNKGDDKIVDRDSNQNKWNEGEDDQDVEHVRVRYFDLALLKYVSKAIVYENGTKNVVETGHTGYEHPEPVVKVDLKQANLKDVRVKFEYVIKITNEGEIPGSADEIKEHIPEGLEFVAADNNKHWTKVDDKTYVTDELKGRILQPGESAEVTLILTWINGENNMGVKNNIAEISKDYNEFGTPDIDSTPDNFVPGEDDIDDAPVMLTVRTGMPKQYIGVGLGILIIITAGVALLRKRVIE